MSGVEYNTWKVADLKAQLKAKGLPVSGNKQDLIERLQSSLLDEGDDLLDQDDSMTAEAILKAEQELKVTAAAPKINRAGPVVAEAEPAEPAPVVTKPDGKPPGKENDPANTTPTKVSAVSAVTSPEVEQSDEKLKARADRFGGFQSDDAKKAARAARFGLGGGGGGGAAGGNKKLGEAPAVDPDTLKKRAERFGGSVSSSLKNIEVQEAIKRRQERFGLVEKNEPKPKKVSLNKSGNSVVLDEKMKARQQRFGLE